MRYILVAAAVWFMPTAAGATNFYVKPGGSDGNAGTSVAAAFQTIQRAANVAQAGDSVLVLPGNYQGFTVKSSGTSDTNRLVFKSTAKWGAVIDRSITATWLDFVDVNSDNYVTIDGFRIEGSTRRGIAMFNTVGLVVRNCYITGCFAGCQGAVNQNTVYEDNVFDANGGDALQHHLYFAAGDCPPVTLPLTGIVIRRNLFKDSLVGTGSALHFVSHRPGYKHEAVVENNIFAWNRGTGPEITAMSVRNTDIRNNLFYSNNSTNGIVQVSSVENWCDSGPMDSADSVRVYNNTIFGPHTKGVFLRKINAYGDPMDGTGFVIFNNIIISSDKSECVVNQSTTAQSIDNNVMHGMNEPGITTILNNLFVDYANDDFRIKSGSEAHNTGLAGLAGIDAPDHDIDGNPRTGNFDIGAYEVVEGTEAPPAPPQNVAAVENTPGCLHVTWRSNSEPDVTGYVVEYGQQSVAQGQATSYASSHDAGAGTVDDICGLPVGTWYVAVRAYDSGGDFSGYSSERTVTVQGPDTGAPNVVLLSPGDGATGVSVDAMVGFSLTDLASGVDTNTVSVTIDGAAAAAISYTGNPARFDAVCRPASQLSPNATVTVIVSVQDLAGNTGGRTWTFTTTGIPPAAPTGASATQTNPGCVTVAWQANTEPDLAGYRVYHGTQSVASGAAAAYSDSVDAGTATSQEVCSLPSGTRYFAVRAFNQTGQPSAYSGELSVDVVTPDTGNPNVVLLSPAVDAVNVSVNTMIGFSLTDLGSGVDTNTVSVSIDGVAPAAISYSGTPARFDAVCRPAAQLPPNTTITVIVSVQDLAGNTGGRTWSFTTSGIPPAIPGGVSAQQTNPGCVTVAWQANSEVDLAGYRIYHGAQSVAQGATSSYSDSVDVGTATARELCALPSGARFFTVRAFNNGGQGSGYSTEQTVNVVSPDIAGPSVLVVNPQRGETGVLPSSRVQFALIDAGSGVDSNSVDVQINGAAPTSVTFSGDPSSMVVTCVPAGSLPPSSTVTVALTASDLAVPPNTTTDSWSFTTTSIPPSAPSGLSAQGTTAGDANLAWNANPETDLAAYVIYFGTESVPFGPATSYPESVTVGANETAYTVGGLVDGTYYFAMRARNDDGLLSPLSGEVSAEVTNGNTQGPLPPQALQVREESPGCMNVSWQPSSEPNVVGYTVHYGPSSVARGETQIYSVSRDVRNVTLQEICSLDPNTYFVAVRAYNNVGAFSGYSTEKSVTVVGADVQGPALSLVYPPENAVGVPQNTKVFLLLSDNFSGVDTLSVSVLIDGSAPASMSFTGNPSSRAVVCDLAAPLPPNRGISVQVTASDMADPANETTRTWMFTTGDAPDTTPPVVQDFFPPNQSDNMDARTQIFVQAWDEVGIDQSRVAMYINGQPTATTLSTDGSGRVTIERTTHGGLPAGVVEVLVVIYDLAGNRRDVTYEFSVGSVVAVASAGPEILPDGYWADDPSRPLEVRNLPEGWTVRIFTTAGEEVRSYQNDGADGATWTWDFANNHGRTVARALYLVRLVDERGSVKETGRFLVRNGR